MSRTKYFFCLSLLAGGASLLIASNQPIALVKPAVPRLAPTTNQSRPVSIPLTFEANEGQVSSEVVFLARGPHQSTFLTRAGIEVEPREPRASLNNLARHRRIQILRASYPKPRRPNLRSHESLRYMEGNRPASRPNQLLHRTRSLEVAHSCSALRPCRSEQHPAWS